MDFKLGNFMGDLNSDNGGPDGAEMRKLITESSVMFFNNFGKWFSEPVGKTTVTPMSYFCDQVLSLNSGFISTHLWCQLMLCSPYTQVVVLDPLIEASHWLHLDEFKTVGCSWSKEALDVFHYTILSYEVSPPELPLYSPCLLTYS